MEALVRLNWNLLLTHVYSYLIFVVFVNALQEYIISYMNILCVGVCRQNTWNQTMLSFNNKEENQNVEGRRYHKRVVVCAGSTGQWGSNIC